MTLNVRYGQNEGFKLALPEVFQQSNQLNADLTQTGQILVQSGNTGGHFNAYLALFPYLSLFIFLSGIVTCKLLSGPTGTSSLFFFQLTLIKFRQKK